MGVKTFETFQSELLLELGNRTDLDNHKGNLINTAYITLTTKNRFWGLNRDFYFPELETSGTTSCTDGTAWVQTPARCLFVREVWDSTNDVHLKKISWNDYVGRAGRTDSTAEGDPKYWVVRDATGSNNAYKLIWLYPTPDGAQGITMYYRKIPAILEDDDDVTAIGVEWDEIILQLAAIQSHVKLGEFDKAEYKKKEWIEMVSGIIGIYDKEDLARKDVRSIKQGYIDRPYE